LFEKLGKRWGDQLEILAFPSQEFGNQEFSSDADIQAFAAKKNFPGTLLKLGKVKGDAAPEVWKFMKEQTGAADPTWNFKGKFLVSKTGQVSVPKDVEADIEVLMNE
jgi:glutathione peroxidase-family protein